MDQIDHEPIVAGIIVCYASAIAIEDGSSIQVIYCQPGMRSHIVHHFRRTLARSLEFGKIDTFKKKKWHVLIGWLPFEKPKWTNLPLYFNLPVTLVCWNIKMVNVIVYAHKVAFKLNSLHRSLSRELCSRSWMDSYWTANTIQIWLSSWNWRSTS